MGFHHAPSAGEGSRVQEMNFGPWDLVRTLGFGIQSSEGASERALRRSGGQPRPCAVLMGRVCQLLQLSPHDEAAAERSDAQRRMFFQLLR